ncbi:hypothetical protein W97_04571 [Coniosporium apollinis CBS 100218]|uniref:Calcineurin-like phosphoesterase domain-containing protein n=1 Tax=Coniosporium apollinis (strain CBS 100218) TaxID=1168221 RepID=R7YU03_CONA1|nr:uncharacterized protein W97_04571 [Coniosporium apollinis CBS 100218]EON65333.1 hypothetical protein W97_04571 [Coniosporium apollinis CBS 100218]
MFSSLHAPASPFDPPSTISVILSSPLRFLLRLTHRILTSLRSSPTPSAHPIRIVCISDTHTLTQPIPDGDILIHAGDLTNAGTVAELQSQINWLRSLPHAHKIAIAGNHDTYLDPRSRGTLAPGDREGELEWGDVTYLQYSSTILRVAIGGGGVRMLNVYGAPPIPACGGPEFAFQYPCGRDAWSDTVPADIDILVTHTPPKYHLDLPASLGCEWLLREVRRVQPALHVFGHVHAGAGREVVWWDEEQSAFERGCAAFGHGWLWDLVSVKGYIELLRVVIFGISGIVWHRVWGGEVRGCVLVNAALTVNNTGKLGNEVQVVEI